MALILSIIQSSNKSGNNSQKDELKSFRIENGKTIGREKADFIVNDSRISSCHAKFEEINGVFKLIDLGSAHGIKVGDKKVKELILKPGMVFRLGKTKFKITLGDEIVVKSPKVAQQPLSPPPKPSPPPPPENINSSLESEAPTKIEIPLKWNEKIADYLDIIRLKFENSTQSNKYQIKPFPKPIILRFTKGIQKDTEWTIGYGPRKIGAGSIDMIFQDTSLVGLSFEILPTKSGIQIRNDFPEDILINGKQSNKVDLKNGDKITIQNTEIEVIL